jgi:hypothetical protein
MSLNSDRHSSPTNLIAYFSIKQRSPLNTNKTRSPIFRNIKQRSPKLWIFHFDIKLVIILAITLLTRVKCMTSREQLIQELIEVPDELVKVVLDFLHRVKTTRIHHPLAKFAGILSDTEVADLQNIIRSDCRQVDINEW